MNNNSICDPRQFSMLDLSLKPQINSSQLLPLPSIIPSPPSLAQYTKTDQTFVDHRPQQQIINNNQRQTQNEKFLPQKQGPNQQTNNQYQQNSHHQQNVHHQQNSNQQQNSQQQQNTQYQYNQRQQSNHQQSQKAQQINFQQQQSPYKQQQNQPQIPDSQHKVQSTLSNQHQQMQYSQQHTQQLKSGEKQNPAPVIQQQPKHQLNQHQQQSSSQQHQPQQQPMNNNPQDQEHKNHQNQMQHKPNSHNQQNLLMNQAPQNQKQYPIQKQQQQQQQQQQQKQTQQQWQQHHQMPVIQSDPKQQNIQSQQNQTTPQQTQTFVPSQTPPYRQQSFNSFHSLSIPNLNTNQYRPPMHTPPQNRTPYVRPPIYRPALSRPPPPKLRKDPILDSKEEISKWREQRMKRYPRHNRQVDLEEQNENELSKLELKLRKKVRILSGSSRRMQVKVKQMKELCKQLTDGYKFKKRVPMPQKQIKLNKEELKPPNDFNIDDFFNDGQHHQESPQLEGFGENADLGQEAMRSTMTDAEMREEIQSIESKLRQQRPKEFFKNQREGLSLEQMNPSQKKKLKNRLKNLKQIVKPLAIETTVTNEEHVKEMIEKLKQQRDNISQVLEQSLDYKSNPVNYRYKSNTLYASLVLDEIYKERSYILQAIRYIVKENFFEPQCDQSVREAITPSEQDSDDSQKQLISSISVSDQISESE